MYRNLQISHLLFFYAISPFSSVGVHQKSLVRRKTQTKKKTPCNWQNFFVNIILRLKNRRLWQQARQGREAGRADRQRQVRQGGRQAREADIQAKGGQSGKEWKLVKASAQKKVYQLVRGTREKFLQIHKWKIIAFSCSLWWCASLVSSALHIQYLFSKWRRISGEREKCSKRKRAHLNKASGSAFARHLMTLIKAKFADNLQKATRKEVVEGRKKSRRDTDDIALPPFSLSSSPYSPFVTMSISCLIICCDFAW